MIRRSSLPIILKGAHVAVDSGHAVRVSVEIHDGVIHRVGEPLSERSATIVDLDGYLILPGLINAHDHLEFNLFPRLGNGPYPSSEAWSRDIYRPESSPLREHRSVPKAVRLWWGGIKNLLSGVTTVCHHNPYEDNVFGESFPVKVIKRYGWAHSLAFDSNVFGAFTSTPPGAPFIIHLGEGTDAASRDEIYVLDRLGALDSRTVIVHGVALTTDGHALRRRRGAALIWCPTSNQFTLGTTLEASSICGEAVALGSDSALSAKGDLLDEIKAAYRDKGVSAEIVYSMVTESAASILRLRDGEGTIREAAPASLIAVPWRGLSPAETLVRLESDFIELVMICGEPRLFSPGMARLWPESLRNDLEWINVGGTTRLICAPVRSLLSTVRNVLPDGVRLVGRPVSA